MEHEDEKDEAKARNPLEILVQVVIFVFFLMFFVYVLFL
jgi:hypothetical protein